MKSLFFSILFPFLSMCAAAICAQDISLHVNPKKVSINDTFSLTFSTPHQIKEAPDLSPLQVDFDIISQGHDKRISILNGQVLQETNWHVVLMGKKPGTWTIPPIHFGSNLSAEQTIEITQASAAKQDDAIFLETELSSTGSIYEQSLLIYTVRLFCSVKLAQATLSDISVSDPDAIVERMSPDAEYDHHHANGKNYRVYERTYAVVPHTRGELTFSPVVFEGAVISGNHSFFDLQTKIKRLHSEQKTITVLPIPAPFHKDNWLFANDVALTEEWSTDPAQASVGEPITRTLKITAKGCLGNQLPDIALDYPHSIKHYLDKPQVSTLSTTEGPVGIKQIKTVFIPTQAVDTLLPPIVLPWWDAQLHALRQAELPAKTIHIANGAIASATIQNAAHMTSLEMTAEKESQATSSSKQLQESRLFLGLNPLISIPFLAALLLAVFALPFVLYIKAYRKKTSSLKHIDSVRKIKKNLKAACHEGRPKEAETYLLIWATQVFPSFAPRNILEIKKRLPQDFQHAIDALYQALYGKSTTWEEGEALWKAVRLFKASPLDKKAVKENLPLRQDLYSRQEPL